MKILYLDLGMGAAGDMLTAALLDLMNENEKADAIKEISSLNIPDVSFDVEKSVKCGITGTHVSVKVNGMDEAEGLHEHTHEHHEHEGSEHEHTHDYDDRHEHTHDHDDGHEHIHDHDDHSHEYTHTHTHTHTHHHASLERINNIVDSLNTSDQIKSDVKAVYKIIAEAESYVHDKPISDIHFHEVGTIDAVADITAVCMLIRKLGADKILASPVHVGSGQVRCAHGILPVPAPATAFILKGIPMYSTQLKGELCTPTGAALLKYFVNEFGPMPAMTSDNIGYGMGYKDFERANCVRAILGDAVAFSQDTGYKNANSNYNDDVLNNSLDTSCQRSEYDNAATIDSIIELRCNLDDMTGEEIGFAMEQLLLSGARDVFTTPITMKKNRPATLLTVLCCVSDKDLMVREIFKHTTTIGIRETLCNRYILDRTEETLNTPLGQVRAKNVSGYGIQRSKLEYEDIAKIARNTGMSIREVKESIRFKS